MAERTVDEEPSPVHERGLFSKRPIPKHDGGQEVSTRLTEDEVEAVLENFAKEDDSANKTWTRLIVEKFLSKVSTVVFAV
jgi:hypothetical protein